jgi:hypothetical protein
VRDEGSVSYSAAIESGATKDTDKEPSAFATRAMREATRQGFDRRDAVLGDGAPWIGNVANDHFPDAVQIVDRFHPKRHLTDVAKAIWGAKSEMHKPWAKARHDELDARDTTAMLAALAVHAEAIDEARKCVDCITTNRDRMNPPQFHAAGPCTSTGVVEAGCKTATGTRRERAGMHWTVAGVDAIIALRCCKLSECFEDLWARRAEGRAKPRPASCHLQRVEHGSAPATARASQSRRAPQRRAGGSVSDGGRLTFAPN